MAYEININKRGSKQRKSNTIRGMNTIYGDNNNISAPHHRYHQLEPAEVLDIILDDSHSKYKDWEDIGKIKARMVNSEYNKDYEQCSWFRPVEANIIDYPLIGEYVVTCKYLGTDYYFNKIAFMNHPNTNMFPGLSENKTIRGKGSGGSSSTSYKSSEASGGKNTTDTEFLDSYSFNPNMSIHPIKVAPGEIVFNGRFGQSIKFGRAKEQGEAYTSPNIKIKVGQRLDIEGDPLGRTEDFNKKIGIPINEDINLDGSSIFITTDEVVPLAPATSESDQLYKSVEAPPEQFDGKQIILNSDRIIFNTKDKEFMCFSKLNQYFSTDAMFLVDSTSDIKFDTLTKTIVTSPEIFLGSEEATEPVVLGEVLKGLMEELIDLVTKSQFVNGAGPASLNPANLAQFETFKPKLMNMLSPQNKTL